MRFQQLVFRDGPTVHIGYLTPNLTIYHWQLARYGWFGTYRLVTHRQQRGRR